jgi:hypothetical protein
MPAEDGEKMKRRTRKAGIASMTLYPKEWLGFRDNCGGTYGDILEAVEAPGWVVHYRVVEFNVEWMRTPRELIPLTPAAREFLRAAAEAPK